MTAKAHGAEPFYAFRPVLNAEEIIAHFKAEGFGTLYQPDEMHVTVALSKSPIDWSWMTMGPPLGQLRIEAGARVIETLGDGDVLALCFDAPQIVAEWAEYRRRGAGWDYPSFKPHITLTKNGGPRTARPYMGPIILGDTKFEVFRPDAMAEAVEKDATKKRDTEMSKESTDDARSGFEKFIGRVLGLKKEFDDAMPVAAERGLTEGTATIMADIVKTDDEMRLVFGFASVTDVAGQTVIDKQGDVISQDTLLKMAVQFADGDRVAKVNHEGGQKGDVRFVFPLTDEIAAAMGITCEKRGLMIGTKVHDDKTWARVKSGELAAFSIGGRSKERMI